MKDNHRETETIDAVQLKHEIQKKAEEKLSRYSEQEQIEILRKKYDVVATSKKEHSSALFEV